MSPYFSEFPSLLQPTSVRQLFGKLSVRQPLTLVEVRCNSFMNFCKSIWLENSVVLGSLMSIVELHQACVVVGFAD